ncbi:hypothetical protein Ancab_029977 [Ancistrocladus abbreviatus]
MAAAAADLCDLQIHIDGQHTFFLNQKIVSTFSGMLKKIIKQEKKKTRIKNPLIFFRIDDFPGGPEGFELISRFCYNNGGIPITVANVSLLHSGAIFLGMYENVSPCNLLQQTETFLEGMFYWSWNDVVACLKSCEPFFHHADSSGLLEKLIFSLLGKIAQNTDISLLGCGSSSSSSSPENSGSSVFPNSSKKRAWWFDDLSTLPPMIIEKVVTSLGAYRSDNNSLILTKFLLHYLKTAAAQPQSRGGLQLNNSSFSGLADTVVYGVISLMEKGERTAFSCRALFWVLRIVTNFGLSKECRTGLERLIGSMLDQAKLDDLLVCGSAGGGIHNGGSGGSSGSVYDVNLVVRLMRVFVNSDGVNVERMKKVGWLIDQYLGEISPDQNLRMSKFMGVAQSLPDMARDCFDGVYRAIDIYLESHPGLSTEERSRLCRCLNYEKLSLEACKDLAKNPRIPPRVTVEALASQTAAKGYDLDHDQSSCESPTTSSIRSSNMTLSSSISNKISKSIVLYNDKGSADAESNPEQEITSEDMRLNIQRMQWRVLELEKLCREMKGQMSKLFMKHHKSMPNRSSPRLC